MSEIDDVELLDKRGYLTICVTLVKDGKVYLRKTEGIREWFRTIRVRTEKSTLDVSAPNQLSKIKAVKDVVERTRISVSPLRVIG